MWNKKGSHGRNETLCHVLPRCRLSLPRLHFLLVSSSFPHFRAVRGKTTSSVVSNPQTISSAWLYKPGKQRSYCPHNLTLLPSPSFPGMASNSIKSSFFTEQLQPRASGNATNCGASIVWAIQWAFHFQSKSKRVKVSPYKLPCWETAACIKITIILFCHVRSKG